ncbi:right-handed parallel beta-helix repeat-containing protein [Candidatus Woesearchaeota archaeon]|nr:right-handed parallel beta-helix repeat-containing protein [Candidatus Woesearchaeota archaeon]
MKRLLLFILVSQLAFAQCVEPIDGSVIKESVIFCVDTYDIPNGISISADNVQIDCATSVLRGILGQSEIGIRVENAKNFTLRNCNLMTFNQGLYLKNVTHSLIEDNAFLKNRVGIRLLESYENVMQDNSDKSYQVPVSAISSKFNIVMLGNRDIERSFCEVNACNEYRDMNVCVSGDFYCSDRCNSGNDDDCVGATPATADEITGSVVEKVDVETRIAELEQEVKEIVAQKEVPAGPVRADSSVPLGAKLLFYAALYFVAFIASFLFKKK